MNYKGKITTTGSSEAIRLDKELFKQNPEFKQQAEVRADVIGPGKLLISVLDDVTQTPGEDPIVDAFLSFLEGDIKRNPKGVIELSEKTISRAKALTDDVTVNDCDFE